MYIRSPFVILFTILFDRASSYSPICISLCNQPSLLLYNSVQTFLLLCKNLQPLFSFTCLRNPVFSVTPAFPYYSTNLFSPWYRISMQPSTLICMFLQPSITSTQHSLLLLCPLLSSIRLFNLQHHSKFFLQPFFILSLHVSVTFCSPLHDFAIPVCNSSANLFATLHVSATSDLLYIPLQLSLHL
jgi:hypothetical protein